MKKEIRGGIDVGSTTVKLVIIDELNTVLFSKYERHYSAIKEASCRILKDAYQVLGDCQLRLMITGSGGMGLAELLEIEFVQEVIACTRTVEELIPETDVVIELGGEDAKITFLMVLWNNGWMEVVRGNRCFYWPNGKPAKTDAAGVNELAKNYQTIYPIASRCGVFAKTDIQPLINEGARVEDISASIFQAVVNQTILWASFWPENSWKSGFLGGPLFFMSELRNRFIETLNLKEEDVIFPDDPQLFVARGAAYFSEDKKLTTLNCLIEKIESAKPENLKPTDSLPPLFKNEAELEQFRTRHSQANINEKNYQIIRE